MDSFISKSLERMRPSATILISQRARALRQGGGDIISLNVGEPDFDTPQNIKMAACKAIKSGKTKYTNIGGILELRKAIAKKFKRDNGLNVSADDCFVATGGKQIIFNALVATLNEGDEVIIPSPYWVSYPEIVRFCGAKPIFVKTGKDDGFKLTPKSLKAAISAKTKWLILNSPSNPSGAVYSASELGELAKILEQYPNIWIFSDDIYEQLVYDGNKFATMAQIAPQLRGRTLTMNGLSKSHAMTGWRIGYCTAPPILIKQMAKLQSQSTSATCSIAQWAAIEALEGNQDFLIEWRAKFSQRRKLLVEGLNKIDGIDCLMPDGAFYAFPSIEKLLGKKSKKGKIINSDEDFALALLEEGGVALVQGSAFGMGGHVRVSYAASIDDIKRALERIEQFISQLK